jgi:hypothetical protein
MKLSLNIDRMEKFAVVVDTTGL